MVKLQRQLDVMCRVGSRRKVLLFDTQLQCHVASLANISETYANKHLIPLVVEFPATGSKGAPELRAGKRVWEIHFASMKTDMPPQEKHFDAPMDEWTRRQAESARRS